MKRPIIVTGMHRSGTTLVSKILIDFGIFMGKNMKGERESLFFLNLNKWIFNQLGGRWDHPPNMEAFFLDKEVYASIIDYINQRISGPGFIHYLGLKNYLFTSKDRFGKQVPWGWKDPRNVYTLPIWLDLFPDAKVIYIERHGVDVANSLAKRSRIINKGRINRYKHHKWMYRWGLKEIEFVSSVKCCHLEESFALWEEYISEAKKNLGLIEPSKVLRLRYEDLLKNSRSVLHEIIQFAEVDVKEKTIANAERNIDSKRAHAYKNNSNLKSFAVRVHDRLERIHG